MARGSWLLGLIFLVGCTAPERSISVAIKVKPTESHEQYLFDVMVESDGQLLAHPKILVNEGQEGEVRIEGEDGEGLLLNVIAVGHDRESDE